MKLLSFRRNGADGYGAVVEGGVVDLGARVGDRWPTLDAAVQEDALAHLREASAGAAPDFPLEDVEFLPPIANPSRIVCVGLNYKTHIEETGRSLPEYPTLFVRHPDSHVGHQQPMIRPKVSDKYDFEGELALVVGRAGRHISKADALDYVAGYSCYNDGSIRDFQAHTTQFTAGKNFWRSGAFGPWLVTADEIPDPSALTLETRLNGQVMQHAPTSDLLFDIPYLIEYVSSISPLRPGDVISTGTTGGVGKARKPPVFMKAGDVIEVELSSIGVLSNPIEDEA